MSRALTEAGRLGGVTDEGFWYTLAAQVLAPHLYAASRNLYSVADILRWIKDPESSIDDVRHLLKVSGHEMALASAESAWSREERVRSSVYTTLQSVLRVFDYDQTSVDDPPFLDLEGLLESSADTLYICAPPDEQEEYRPLFTGLVRTIVRLVYAKNGRALDSEAAIPDKPDAVRSGERKICPLLLLLDEAGNIAPLENLDTLATTAAGTRVQMVTVFHDLSQIESVYGIYTARSIVNNHSALLVLPGGRDEATLTYVEALLRGERVANSSDATWSGPRPIRTMRDGDTLLIYQNQRPIVVALRSKFTDDKIARRVAGGELANIPPSRASTVRG
jgi:type IV secretory pathway TraG/TraD family ATPase VirD4